jgi:hypothetical protein
MGIRTPDLLHAMERRPVQDRPPQYTSDPPELGIRSDRVASVHHSSPRTVTSLVTSPRHVRACPAKLRLLRIAVPHLAGPLPQPGRQASRRPGSAQCTPGRPDRTASARARRPA